MKKKRNILLLVIIALFLSTASVAFGITKNKNIFEVFSNLVGASNETKPIELTVITDESNNSAKLTWTNPNTGSFDYTIKRGVNKSDIEDFTQIFALPENPIQVLNVSPVDPNGKNKDKWDTLSQWMKSYGKDLIEVNTVYIENFNKENGTDSYKEQLKKETNGDYKYDIIFFGTWDSNNSKDLSANSAKAVEEFIKDKHSVIFGHDTIANIGSSGSLYHPNFVSLQKYVNIEAGNEWNSTHNYDTKVKITKHGVFTSYPYYIGAEGTILTIPTSHNLGQVANGDIWLQFDNENAFDHDGAGKKYQSNKNFYLTTSKEYNCAMIQTGHSSGDATEHEQQIIANLIFYLWYQTNTNNNPELVDKSFVDVNAPDIPHLSGKGITTNIVSNGKSTASVQFTATDKGTHYRWEVEGTDNADESINQGTIRSNVVERTRITGVSKYQYYIDDQKDTKLCTTELTTSCVNASSYQEIVLSNPDDVPSPINNIEIANTKQTYLHIRAVDGAGNLGEQADILIYEDVAPEISTTKTPTEWIKDGSVTLTVNATDIDGTISKIEYAKSSDANNKKAITANEATITENGTYIITATDNAGKETSRRVEVTNIDKELPTIGNFEITKKADINNVATADVNVEIIDNISGIKKVDLVCGTDSRNIETDEASNDGIHKGLQKQKVNFELTDADLAKTGGCHLEVTDFAGNTTSKNITVASKVTIKYVDVLNHELDVKAPYVKNGNAGDNLTINNDELVVTGYDLVASPDSIPAKYTIADQTLTYVYAKKLTITVNYVDINNPETTLFDSTIIAQDENTNYTVSAKHKDNYITLGYKIGTPSTTDITSGTTVTGTMGTSDITITFYYVEISEGLTIKYIDLVKDEEIAPAVTITENATVGEVIDITDYLKDVISDYHLVEKPNSNEVTLEEEITVIKLGYRKEIELHILGKDAISGEVLYETTKKGLEGESYTTEPETDFPNNTLYKLTKTPTNVNGTYARENTEVVYLYNHLSAGIRVQYINQDTNTIIDEIIIEGNEGDQYTTTEKTYEKYELALVEGPTSGEMTIDEIVVKYYYTKKTGKVTVIYEDENGNVLKTANFTDKLDEEYDITLEHIYGYNVKEILEGSLSGNYSEEEQTIRVVLEKMSSKITVRYLDEEGNVLDTYESENFVGEDFEFNLPEKEGYYLVSEPTIKTKFEENDNTIDVYYKKIVEVSNPKTLDLGIARYLIIGAISIVGLAALITKKLLKH